MSMLVITAVIGVIAEIDSVTTKHLIAANSVAAAYQQRVIEMLSGNPGVIHLCIQLPVIAVMRLKQNSLPS